MKPWRELVESGAVDLMDPVERLQLADLIEEQGGADFPVRYAMSFPDGVLYREGKFYPRHAKDGQEDFCDYSDCVTYCNQREVYGDSLEGDWYYCDDVNCVIYYGSFGNDHSPGSSFATRAEVFDTRAEYEEAKADWESQDEYDEDDEESSHASNCPARYGGPCTQGCVEDDEDDRVGDF